MRQLRFLDWIGQEEDERAEARGSAVVRGYPTGHEETTVADTPTSRSADRSRAQASTGWVGWLVFAGIMMILVGSFQAIDGLIALFKDELYVVRPNGMVINVDYTTWGWTHLLLGVLLIAAGFAVFSGRVWGRTLGVIVALLSAIANFAFIPAYPIWSLLIITVDVLVIYALIAHGGELREDRY